MKRWLGFAFAASSLLTIPSWPKSADDPWWPIGVAGVNMLIGLVLALSAAAEDSRRHAAEWMDCPACGAGVAVRETDGHHD